MKMLPMKNKIFSLLLVIAAFTFHSCDKIDAPYGQTVEIVNPSDSIVQKVLLEDFTGFHCTNCPNAHRKAQQLVDVYGDRLLVLGLHVGIYAQPNIWGPLYTYDFRTTTATDIYTTLANNEPLPVGMVNRTEYQGAIPLFNGSWPSAVAAAMAQTPRAGIKFTNMTYNATTRAISGSVNVQFVQTIADEANISFYVVEDSIIQPQLDNGVDIPAYLHKHVIRGALNTTWGQSVGTANASGSSKEVTFSGTLSPSDALPEHCMIYAILTDQATKAVINVEEKHIIN